MSLINCKIGLAFLWSRNCVIFEISKTAAVAPNQNANPPVQAMTTTRITGAIFQITSSKLYVPMITLSANNTIKLIENLKPGFKTTISWKKIYI